jgi:hypothetical protein
MANIDKNILITPNRGANNDPKIDFVGANANVGPQTITMSVYPDSNGTLSWEGSAGQLFSITNDLTGTIFSVNDVSGIPSLEINANGQVTIAEFSGNVGIGLNNPGQKLDVTGSIRASSQLISTVTTGTAPLLITSTTRVPNLNVATAGTADVLTTARTINGTSFNGSVNITTDNWGTARNINGTSVNGSANYAIGRIYDTNYRRFTNPGGGEYVTTTSSVTGAIEVVFPNTFSLGMYKLVIEVYEYTTNESFTVYAAGHTSGTLWYNTTAYIIGNPGVDRRFNVRFGRNAANRAVVYIGEVGSVWSYPQVFLTEFQCGFSGFQDNSAGWAINFRTAALENVSQTISNCQIGYAVSTNTATSVVLRDGSGNFSAGTITATLSGNATTATTLQTARTINGTSFNGSANITTANWGTARTIWGQSINGSVNITAPVLPAAGSVSAPAFSTSGDTDTGIFFPAADTMAFTEGGAEAMRITSAGNVGIGTTTPGAKLEVNGTVLVSSTNNLTVRSITTGAAATSGTITGTWTLTAGSKLQATYADLAEYYEADIIYSPGTVLEFGGDKEVTIAKEETNRLAGVVSTNPAYVMNNNCPGNKVAIALQGRCPVKVKGSVYKGDMIVSAGNGYAKAVSTTPTIGTVLGKSLENFNGKEGIIEIAVGRV